MSFDRLITGEEEALEWHIEGYIYLIPKRIRHQTGGFGALTKN